MSDATELRLDKWPASENREGTVCGDVVGGGFTIVLLSFNSGKQTLAFFLSFHMERPQSRLIDNSLIEGVDFTRGDER
jgi:hypothetical protein